MNAYELADEFKNRKWDEVDCVLWCEKSANMLREQADELDKVVPQLVKANGLIENLRLRIAELEKQLEEKNKPPTKIDTLMESQARKFWGSLDNQCHGYTTPQTKPLSDEEIKQIWYDLYPLSSSSYWDDKREGIAELKFARAIEERHGIK